MEEREEKIRLSSETLRKFQWLGDVETSFEQH
jgi:hypothetical protein